MRSRTLKTTCGLITFGKYAAAALLALAFTAGGSARAATTPYNTTLTSVASIKSANSETATNSLAITVADIYGIATSTEPLDGNTTTGGSVVYKITYTNNGNNTDVIKLNAGSQTFGPGAGTTANWSVETDDADPFAAPMTWANSGTTKAAQSGDYVTATLAPGAQGVFSIRITSASNAGDLATMSVPISLETSQTRTGKYNGYNSLSYGGLALAVRTAGAGASGNLTTTIQGAIITLSKSVSALSPPQYQALGGNAAAPVPGSKITYTITYGNSGAAAAAGVTIIDSIPSDTAYLPGTITTSAFGAQTDAADAGQCDYNVSNALSVTCNVGTVNSGASGMTISYAVTIN
ncbi:MAG: hypothetical protein WCX65_04635 [bacterium]